MLKSLRFQPVVLTLLLLILSTSIVSAAYFLNVLSTTTPPPAGYLAADKGYGVTIDLTTYDDEVLQQTLEELHTNGLTWLRQPVRWAEIEPEPGQYRWQSLDRISQALADFNQQTSQPTNQPTNKPANQQTLKLIAVLHTAPRWARAPHTISTAPPLASGDFGDFAATFATRYGEQVAVYQIWDEPNLSANWGHTFVDAPAYTALLREAALRIRDIDSNTVIMAAALAPTLENGPLNLNEIDYLEQLYQTNADRWFDVVAAQPYGFDREPSDPATSRVLNFRRIELLRQVMLRHGDVATPIWATAFGWNALPIDWSGPKSPWKTGPPDLQAQRTTKAIDLARQNWPWLGPMLAIRWDSVGLERDDPARGFSLRDTPPVQVALQTATTRSVIATPGNYPADHPSGHYSLGWRWAVQQADIPRNQPRTLAIEFEGTQLNLDVNRSDFRGYLWVTVDGQPANALPQDNQGRSYVVLYDPLREPANVTLASHLPDTFHRAEITAEGGWGQWAIAGWSVSNRHDPTLARIGILAAGIFIMLSGAALGKMASRDFETWRRFLRIRAAKLAAFSARHDERLLFAFTAILAVGLYFSSGNGAIVLLILLAFCLLLRPDFGLVLIAFGLSFLPNTKSVPLFDVSLLEAVLALSALGVLRQLVSHQPSAISGQPWRSWLAAPLAFLGLGLMVTVFAQNFGVSMFAWRTMVLGPVIFYMLILLVAQPKASEQTGITWRLVDAFVAGGVVHALIALVLFFFDHQFINAEGVRRAVGPIYPTPNNLALFVERSWPILLAVALLPGQSKLRRNLYGLGLAVISFTLYLTFSRGTLLLSLPLCIIGMGLLTGLARRGWRRGFMAAAIGLAVLLIALLPTARWATIIDYSRGTGFFRLKLWHSALMMLRDHVLVGVGLDNFLYQYRTLYILPDAWQEPNLSHPHNVLLDFGTRMGLGGMVVFIWLQIQFWSSIWTMYKKDSAPLLLGFMGSMIVILSHGLVDHAYFLVDLAFAFFLIFGIVQRFRLSDLPRAIAPSADRP